MLAGTAGTPLVPWRGLIEPLIFLGAAPKLIVPPPFYSGYEILRSAPYQLVQVSDGADVVLPRDGRLGDELTIVNWGDKPVRVFAPERGGFQVIPPGQMRAALKVVKWHLFGEADD